jgi:outer membrane protein assembly factor BamB
VGDDPDAIWKPGFTGEVVHGQPVAPPLPPPDPPADAIDGVALVAVDEPAAPAHAAPPPTHRRRLTPLQLVALGAVVVIVAATLALTLPGGRHAPSPSAVEHIPTAAARQWSATVPGHVDSVIGTADVVLVTSAADGRTVTALDGRDGSRLWRRVLSPSGIEDITIIDGDVVYAAAPGRDGVGDELVGLDSRSGEERWRRRLPGPFAAVMEGHRIIVQQVGTLHSELTELDLIDPHTGRTRRSIEGDITFFVDGVQTRDGDVFRLFDLDTFERIDEVSLPALHGEPARITPTETGTLAITATRAVLFDARGVPLSSHPLPPQEGGLAPLVLNLGGVVVVQSGEVVTALTVADGQIGAAWSRPGELADRTGSAEHALLAVQAPSSPPSPSSDAPIALVDASTGVTAWTGMAPVRPPERLLADNGIVAEATGSHSRRSLAGVGLDGTVLWRHTVTAGADTALIDGAVVEYEATPGRNDKTTLTLLR